MIERLCFDKVQLDAKKIKIDNDDEMVIETVVASEIVHKYNDGWAYKPADELEKSAWTMNHRLVKILAHPDTGLLSRTDDVSGQIDNVRFVKNLNDPKTGRPMRKGIVGDLHLWKHTRGHPGAMAVPEEVLEQIRSGDLHDCSIGFTFRKDETKGDFNGVGYDYIQRSLFLDHLAAPIAGGRCPAPYCGLGVDQIQPIMIGLDPWEESDNNIRSGHVDPGKFDPQSLRTINIEKKGVKAIVGCPKGNFEDGKCSVGMKVQSYLFSKEDGWTMETAKSWFESHKDVDDSLSMSEIAAKIDDLRERREGVRKKIDDYYAKLRKAEPEMDPALEKLYNELEDIDLEIQAYKEVKIKKIIGEGAGDAEGDEEDCPVCDKIKELGLKGFAQLIFDRLGADAIGMILKVEPIDEGDGSDDGDADDGQGTEEPSDVDVVERSKETHELHKTLRALNYL